MARGAILEVQRRGLGLRDLPGARLGTGSGRGLAAQERGSDGGDERQAGDQSGGAAGSRTVPAMTAAHVALAWLAATSIVVVLVVALVTAAGRTRGYAWLDRALLAQLALTGLTVATGVATFLVVRPPGDPLHLVYGGVTAGAPLVARIALQGRDPQRLGRWVAVAAAVAIGATVRSFMTGS
jgi:hypothetical protein